MPRNVEIKARVEDPSALLARVSAIAERGPFEIRQDDTFFACPNGRLKLRELAPSEGQLIFYERADSAGPKVSTYFISPTSEPATLRHALASALGVTGRIRKRRLLFLTGPTRIHLDEVEGLGHFIELEVVLADDESVEAGERVAYGLMHQLGILPRSLLTGAYVDLSMT